MSFHSILLFLIGLRRFPECIFPCLRTEGKEMTFLKLVPTGITIYKEKKNSEFDVVFKTTKGYELFECKFLENREGNNQKRNG